MSTTKPTVARLYLNGQDAANAANIAESLGESQSWLLSKIVSEGLRALHQNGGTFRLPLRFHLDGEAEPARAAPPKRKTA